MDMSVSKMMGTGIVVVGSGYRVGAIGGTTTRGGVITVLPYVGVTHRRNEDDPRGPREGRPSPLDKRGLTLGEGGQARPSMTPYGKQRHQRKAEGHHGHSLQRKRLLLKWSLPY